jgi:hypothetical protein
MVNVWKFMTFFSSFKNFLNLIVEGKKLEKYVGAYNTPLGFTWWGLSPQCGNIRGGGPLRGGCLERSLVFGVVLIKH